MSKQFLIATYPLLVKNNAKLASVNGTLVFASYLKRGLDLLSTQASSKACFSLVAESPVTDPTVRTFEMRVTEVALEDNAIKVYGELVNDVNNALLPGKDFDSVIFKLRAQYLNPIQLQGDTVDVIWSDVLVLGFDAIGYKSITMPMPWGIEEL